MLQGHPVIHAIGDSNKTGALTGKIAQYSNMEIREIIKQVEKLSYAF